MIKLANTDSGMRILRTLFFLTTSLPGVDTESSVIGIIKNGNRLEKHISFLLKLTIIGTTPKMIVRIKPIILRMSDNSISIIYWYCRKL